MLVSNKLKEEKHLCKRSKNRIVDDLWFLLLSKLHI